MSIRNVIIYLIMKCILLQNCIKILAKLKLK
jgi:hypothetical protein